MSAAFEVLRADLPVTIQDLGRPDAQRYGVPVGGALDRFALVAANRLVSNPADAAALEITAGGASFGVLRPLYMAVAGAELGATLDNAPLPLWTAVLVRPGQELHFHGRLGDWGGRAYLAVAGGVDVPVVLRSRSTSLPGAFGGLEGRPLRRGDRLVVGGAGSAALQLAGQTWPVARRPAYAPIPALRVLPGPHQELFTAEAIAALTSTRWQIGPQSNRTGYRLAGRSLHYRAAANVASHGVVPGAIQVPPDGGPILLLADAQTTGGYPLIAVVIGADLPLAAQLLPGDTLRFAPTTPATAIAALRELNSWMQTPLPVDPELTALGWAGAPGQ